MSDEDFERENRLDRDFEREPARRRQRVPLVATGTLRARFADRQRIPVIRDAGETQPPVKR